MTATSSSICRGQRTAGLSALALTLLCSTIAAAQPHTFDLEWGSFGSGDGQLDLPFGVAADASGNVYVGDTGNDRIQKFNPPIPLMPATGLLGLCLLAGTLAVGGVLRIMRRPSIRGILERHS